MTTYTCTYTYRKENQATRVGSFYLKWRMLREIQTQGRTQGGLEVHLPLSFTCNKKFITCAREINCFRILFACQFVDLMQIPRNEFACKFQGTLQMDRRVIIRFWWESGLSSASRNHLTTFCRLFVHYTCLRLCSAIVNFMRNNCLLFCLLWLISACADRINYITNLCSMTELLHELKNSSR